jgi:hypothetical protein
MAFCDHCEGQRFDRAQVLRALRDAKPDARQTPGDAEQIIAVAIETVRALGSISTGSTNPRVEGEPVH